MQEKFSLRFATALLMASMPFMSSVAMTHADSIGWRISTPVPCADYYGATIANGRLGITSGPHILRNERIILSGTFDQAAPDDIIRLLEGWNMLNLSLSVNGRELHTDDATDFTQTFNMRAGCMESSFNVAGVLSATYCTVAVGGMANSAFTEVSVTPIVDVELKVTNSVLLPAGFHAENATYSSIPTQTRKPVELLSAVALTPQKRMNVGMASGFVFSDEDDCRITRFKGDFNSHSDSISQGFIVNLRKGECFTFAIAGAACTDAEVTLPQRSAERAVITMELEGLQPAKRSHEAYWNRMWEGDIEIEGNDTDQQEVRYMLYSIYSSVEPWSSASPSPFGLSTTGYSGHVFWDTDLWMFRPMQLLNPGIAASMVDYRTERLDAALKNRRLTGGRSLYPWESDNNGEEQTPVGATTGIQEIHISACIALAVHDHFLATGDTLWLRSKGYPVLAATADYWAERAVKEADGRWHILNVVGADEFAENVDDNAFTNAAARKNLRVAAQAAELLGIAPPAKWLEVADGLVIHTMPNDVTAEYRGYDGARAKQADVNLLAYPLGEITDSAQIARDLDYYSSIIGVDSGPAMTEAIFSILYARCGDWEKAARYFNQSYKLNRYGPFRGISECKHGRQPYFITGAGGALQAILMGYAGLDITPDGIKRVVATEPVLPNNWRKLTIKLPGRESVVIGSASSDASTNFQFHFPERKRQ